LSNYLLEGIGPNDWRWMMGVEAFPALAYTAMVFFVPMSPRWLVSKDRVDEAASVLQVLGSDLNIDDLVKDHAHSQSVQGLSESVLDKKYRFPLTLAILLAFFNQFSGINAFLYYAPRIFEAAGLGASTALLSGIGVGVVNLIFTLIGINLIDRLGRKTLMYWGSFGYIVSLSLVALAFAGSWGGLWVPIFLFLFIASHAIGQGTVIWVYISEVFPNHLRSSGQAWGTSTHWVLAAIIPSMVPVLFTWIGPAPVFGFFALMMVLQLAFVRWMMPETKGVPLEELSASLTKSKK
jgi:sugar porter (SP) family MFS transporter